MNKSKVNDFRSWNKWKKSGAVENYETACLRNKDFDKTTRAYTVSKVSELENNMELKFKEFPITLNLRFNATDLVSSRPDLIKKIQENDKLLLESFKGTNPEYFWGTRTIKGMYQILEKEKFPVPIYVREF